MKKILCLLLVCFLVVSIPFSSNAFSKKEHDDYLEQVLFGEFGYFTVDISELQKHINVLFKEQNHSKLDNQIKQLRNKALNDVLSSNNEYSMAYYGYAEELMDILIQEIPDLLKEVSFFTKVFPPN